MNCQSIKNKKAVFNLFIDEHQPDLIVGSKSWLSSTVYPSELFTMGTENIEQMATDRVESGLDDPDNLGHLGHFLEGQVGPIHKLNYLDATRIYYMFFRKKCWDLVAK